MDGRIQAESNNYKKVYTKEMASNVVNRPFFALTFNLQRQKQYFEQRRRQKQHHTAGLQGYTDGESLLRLGNKEQRSLDVLSLLNLSSIVQECKASSPNVGENSEVNTSAVNYQIKRGPPTILTNGATPVDHVEFNGKTGASLSYQVKTVSLKSDADRNNNAINGKGDKQDNWKTATEQELSVFDLLGDEGPYSNLEGSPYEAHVAFAVEGLGKVGTETPVHSPHQPQRMSSHDHSLPLKDARQLRSSNNFNFMLDDLEAEVDAMMQGINRSPSCSSLKLPFHPMGLEDTISNPEPGASTFREFMGYGGHSCKIRRAFGEEDIFCNVKDKNENMGIGSSGCLDYDSPNIGEFDLSWKHWPDQMDDTSYFVNIGNHDLFDLTSEGPCISKKRNAMKAIDRFNISDLSAPYLGYQTPENDCDFATSYGIRSPTLGRVWGFTDLNDQPDWPSFAIEDARDSLSLPSEESCSSSAARGEATYNPPSHSMATKSLRRDDKCFCCRVNKCGSKSIRNTREKIGSRRNNGNGLGEFLRKSNPSSSKAVHHSNSAFLGRVGPEESWLFEDINPDFSSLYQTLETKKAFPGPKLWTDSPPGAFPVPELHTGAEPFYKQSKKGSHADYSPSSTSFSEEPAFYKPSNHTQTYGSSLILGDIDGSRPDEPDLCAKMGVKPPDAFFGDVEFNDIDSAQESDSKGDDHASSIQPTDGQKFGLEREICNGNTGLSSEAGKTMDASNLNDSCSGCKEAEDATPEAKATNSCENAEEASLEVKFTHKGDEEGKGCQHDTQLPLEFQNRNGEPEDRDSEERRVIIRREQSICPETVDPSCQVMMLESYVLQLLCVQKVMKEPSVQDYEKKV